MTCNTVAFHQALDIYNSPSVCSVQQVSDMMNNSQTLTHTQSFWSVTRERSGYLSFKTKNTSYTYEYINISCSINSYGYSSVLQVHPEVHPDHSGVLEGPFHHPPTPGSSQKWKRLMYAWFQCIGSRQAML